MTDRMKENYLDAYKSALRSSVPGREVSELDHYSLEDVAMKNSEEDIMTELPAVPSENEEEREASEDKPEAAGSDTSSGNTNGGEGADEMTILDSNGPGLDRDEALTRLDLKGRGLQRFAIHVQICQASEVVF